MSKTVMIVDDEADTIRLVKTLLESEGYNVMSALTGKGALETLKTGGQRPDLVLLDMFMPEMSGRELCERIRKDEKLDDLKVAFFTVAAFKEQGKKTLKDLGVLDYIVKPFSNQDFLRRVRRLLEE